MVSNPVQFAVCTASYVAIVILWSFWKWYDFLSEKRDAFRDEVEHYKDVNVESVKRGAAILLPSVSCVCDFCGTTLLRGIDDFIEPISHDYMTEETITTYHGETRSKKRTYCT